MLRRSLKRFVVVLLLAAASGLGLSACSDPCEELANRLCASPGCEAAQCERWHERTARVPTETCEAGLRSLDRERVH